MRTAAAEAEQQTERERWARERLLEALDAYRRGTADAPIVSKAAVGGVRAAPADGPVTFVASDETEDRMGDVIAADGWELEAYQRNPVFLWAHDYTRAPVGRAVWTGVEGKRLLTAVVFAPTPFAREVETLYRQGFLRAVSVGFRAKAFAFRASSGGGEGVRFTRQELVEVSARARPRQPERAGQGDGGRTGRAAHALPLRHRRGGGGGRAGGVGRGGRPAGGAGHRGAAPLPGARSNPYGQRAGQTLTPPPQAQHTRRCGYVGNRGDPAGSRGGARLRAGAGGAALAGGDAAARGAGALGAAGERRVVATAGGAPRGAALGQRPRARPGRQVGRRRPGRPRHRPQPDARAGGAPARLRPRRAAGVGGERYAGDGLGDGGRGRRTRAAGGGAPTLARRERRDGGGATL